MIYRYTYEPPSFALSLLPFKNFRATLRNPNRSKSFTLVELLIVIGILAILTAAVAVIINPAQRLKEARDGTRIEEISSLHRTISLLETQIPNLSLGTPLRVYISIPDTSSSCNNLGLPALPAGYVYQCVTAANLRNTNGTGWIPVNFQSSGASTLQALPIDPTNTTSSGLYYRYIPGGSYHLEALLESNKHIAAAQSDGGSSPVAIEKGTNLSLMPPVFPTGYIKVPGNGTFGTSDFYVMQYEAKCFQNNQPLPYTISDGGEGATHNIYRDFSFPCTSANSKYIGSSVSGAPITRITQTSAITYCQNNNAHLLTNNEWQTITWNIQNNPQNWSGGSVGSGYIGRGNSNTSAAMSDANPLSGNNLRKHILSNGAEIWDIAGNVWEWNSDTVVGTSKPASGSSSWVQWNTVSSFGSFTRDQIKPVSDSYTSSHNIGQYYRGSNVDGTVYAFLRGASWMDGAYTGVSALALSGTPGDTYQHAGFRCAR